MKRPLIESKNHSLDLIDRLDQIRVVQIYSTPRLVLAALIGLGGAIVAVLVSPPLLSFALFAAAFGGALIFLTAGVHDKLASEQRRSELKVRRTRFEGRSDAYQDIIDSIDIPVLLVRNARVAFANESALTVLGDHVIGQDVRLAIRHPAAAERLANPDAVHTGEPILLVGVGSRDQRWQMRMRSLDDGLKLVQLSDQSSRYAAEKMRTDFVANASHELRTPLAAIKGFIETLQNPEAGEDKAVRARFLNIMYNEADRMQRLVEDLMSLSRIEAEKFQLPDTAVDVGQLIADTKAFFVESRNKRDSEIIVESPTSLPAVSGDQAQLSQLLHNLISNAFKYGEKGAPVTISVNRDRAGSMLHLAVKDCGDGIEADHLPRLTERFYRVDKGRSRSMGGTGLGLAIVKHITERHGGRLEISSQIGVGTTVRVSLPLRKTDNT